MITLMDTQIRRAMVMGKRAHNSASDGIINTPIDGGMNTHVEEPDGTGTKLLRGSPVQPPTGPVIGMVPDAVITEQK